MNRIRTRVTRSPGVGLALLLCVACSYDSQARRAVDAVERFHSLYNDQLLTEIYEATAPAFKKGTSEASWLEFAGAVRRKLGKHVSAESRGSRASRRREGVLVVVSVLSTFEYGKALEDLSCW